MNQLPAEDGAATSVSPILVVRPKRIIKPPLKGRENLGFTMDDPVINDFIDLLSVFSHSFRCPKYYTLEQQWEMSYYLARIIVYVSYLLETIKRSNH